MITEISAYSLCLAENRWHNWRHWITQKIQSAWNFIAGIPGYQTVTPAVATGTMAYELTCTADTSNTITITQDSHAAQCTYHVTLTSNTDDTKTYSVNAAAKNGEVVLKIPDGFHYEITLPVQNGSDWYSLLYTNPEGTQEEVTPSGERYVIQGDTSAGSPLNVAYTVNTLYESENTFAVNWEADGMKWTCATASTDKQVYAVTIEKQGRSGRWIFGKL